jgi:DsbC/DsbD-like thiol-disulfide interchange protein
VSLKSVVVIAALAAACSRPEQPAPERPAAAKTETFADASSADHRISAEGIAVRQSPTKYDLVVRITPHRGMHVYAPGAANYVPISLQLAPAPGVTAASARYPKAEEFYFAPTSEHLPVYQQPFEIVQPVTVSGVDRPTTIAATLRYQACDDRLCYTPQDLPVTFELTSVRSETPSGETPGAR